MCNCSQNQTHKDSFEFAKEMKIDLFKNDHLGIGRFLVPAPEIGILEYKSIEVKDLAYRECVKRGNNCVAFLWIPYGITLNDGQKKLAINSIEDFESLDLSCNDACRGGCPLNGCFCYVGETQCHK